MSAGFSCFGYETNRCRNMIDGDERFAGSRGWAMGTDASGQAHYACPCCASALFNPKRLDTCTPWQQPAPEQLDAWESQSAPTQPPRCQACGQIDEPEIHDAALCPWMGGDPAISGGKT